MIAFVRQTGMKVLVCPEDRSHMAVGKEMLVDPLPEDVRAKVVWRETFWLTDEAVSVYSRALALLSMDMHSPIMALANGTPAILCRFQQHTCKTQMWRDIGLGEWMFDLDEQQDGSNISAAVLAITADPGAARAKAARAMTFVRRRQRETMANLQQELGR
jgi:polysaccharide pyruvyl transferase WcaK-like protein